MHASPSPPDPWKSVLQIYNNSKSVIACDGRWPLFQVEGDASRGGECVHADNACTHRDECRPSDCCVHAVPHPHDDGLLVLHPMIPSTSQIYDAVS